MTFDAVDLTVRYRARLPPALDGVTMHVPRGCFYAVLGPNGSGKSTLVRALLGSVPRTSGTVRIDGRSLDDWGRREVAQAVGVVTQTESIAFPIRVRDMVAMGRYPHLGRFAREGEADTSAIQRAISRCELEEITERDVGTLSGGEFQRVRVARALAQAPRALVLDEPTASLDIRHEMEILMLLRHFVDGGMTVLVVTHHLDAAARFADRMLLLDNGRVASEGTPASVLQEDTLRDVYRWPLAVRPDPMSGHLRVTPLI